MTHTQRLAQAGSSTPRSGRRAKREASTRTADRIDPSLLTTFAVRAVCHSEERISCGFSATPDGRVPETIAATDDVPVRVDWLQRELGQGPDLAPGHPEVAVSKDLAGDERWPDFGRMCVAALGLRSMVSVVIPMPGIRATMKFFAEESTAFDRFDVDAALRLVRLAVAPTSESLRLIPATGRVPAQAGVNHTALALAIVMAQCQVGSPEGFEILQNSARSLHRDVFDLAVEVVVLGRLPAQAFPDAGADPGTTSRPARAGGQPLSVGGPEMWREPSAQRHLPTPGGHRSCRSA